MNYSEAQKYIEEVGKLESRAGIESIKELLKRLSNPQDKLNVIHVAGTNGKGSTCAYLEYALREAGFVVGRYISPTLFTYLERFQINGQNMPEEEYADIMESVKVCCDEMVEDGLLQPTAFEIETAISFIYFYKKNVDIVILEAGMGGKEDASNVVKKPIATVFASISFDHMQFLGDTISEIAETKAGIMREGVPVIASHMPELFDEGTGQNESAVSTLKKCAKEKGAPFYYADDLYSLTKGFSCTKGNENKISEIAYNGKTINNPLKGEFQFYNMEAALLTVSVLKDTLKGILYDIDRVLDRKVDTSSAISMQKFIKGIEKTQWPGRFEIVSKDPLIIRDGAHNPDAVRLLKESVLKDKDIPNNLHLIMGVFKDKEYEKMLKEMMPIAGSFTAITPPNKARALKADELCECAKKVYKEISDSNDCDIIYIGFRDSLEEAIKSIEVKQGEGILVFGSLSLASLFV